MHNLISPAIFYWGTPVVLISSLNEDGTTNIAPMSSAWWLGNRCVLGLAAASHTTANILRTKQCVLNLASDDMGDSINALARTTGTADIDKANPGSGLHYFKRTAGYASVHDKFTQAGLTPQPSLHVQPLRVMECPAQMEGELVGVYEMFQGDDSRQGLILALEIKVICTHVEDGIRSEVYPNRIDTDTWRPMIMSFQELYGLKSKKVAESDLAGINEESYRGFSNPILEEAEYTAPRPAT